MKNLSRTDKNGTKYFHVTEPCGKCCGTVKEHKDYDNVQQTILTRCKRIRKD